MTNQHTNATSRMRYVLLATLVLASGCTRGFYREQADREAYSLIEEKQQPESRLPDYTIDLDPRSRMYDGNSPDHPPMPPDDPASHRLMHCIDCKKGYPCWHANGDTPFVENPNWRSFIPLNDQGALVLGEDDAFRLALIHSRQYQRELETLYLSALDVSFERFRFDTQFFAGHNTTYTADGRLRNGLDESQSVLDLDTGARGIRMETLYPTGAELVVGLANSLVWQFSGPDSHAATTLLDFALVQPLLRQGGRDRVMERLTIAERQLLANVRQMERFRRGFYVEITTGRNSGDGPTRRGGFFGGAGLEGFTGVGGGGFGRVGSTGGFTGGAGATQAGGYLGLLQDQQDIRNQEANIGALRSSLAQLESFFLAGRIDYYQVELARQALYNAQSRLLNTKVGYQESLDSYKLELGLPPTLELVIEDDALDQFNLIDPKITPIQRQLADAQESVGEQIVKLLTTKPQEPITWNPSIEQKISDVRLGLKSLIELYEQVFQENIPRAAADIEALRAAVPRRSRDLQNLRTRLQESDDQRIDNRIVDSDRLEALPNQLVDSLQNLTQRLQATPGRITELDQRFADLLKDGPTLESDALDKRIGTDVLAIPNLLTEITAQVLELTLLQVRARTESVRLTEIDMVPEDAIEIASLNRRDLKNARASLVDSWRLIQFNANDLESGLDVVFSGDISNTGDNPIRLRDATGRLRVGLQFDAPITRLAERNNYRQALIEYQQARRSFYTFQDQIARGLRSTIRTIELHKLNFELRRAAVHVAVAQVELARLRLQEPPKPNETQVFGATTARDLVTALTDLLNVQNDFLSVWVNYEVQRRSLDFDLGTMQVDAEGIWIDPGSITRGHGKWESVEPMEEGLELMGPEEVDAPPAPEFLLPDP